MVYLLNISKRSFIGGGSKYLVQAKEWIEAHGGGLVLPFSIEFEEELNCLKEAGEAEAAKVLLAELGGKRTSMLNRIIKCGYRQLHLMYYFTAGEKEVRCWTIMEGATAPQAAGVIHSDFEKGFIKAE